MSKVIIVEGVGINDLSLCGPHYVWCPEKQDSVATPEFRMWYQMIRRSFSEALKKSLPSLSTSTCSEEWLHRINFQKWYFDQGIYFDNSGKTLSLDKDILFLGNNCYSKETCVLVPQYLNAALRDLTIPKSSGLPMWAFYRKPTHDMVNEHNQPYGSRVICLGKAHKVGFFYLPEEAHFAAQLVKASCLENELLPKYRLEKCFRFEVEEAILRIANKLREDNRLGKISKV